MKNKIESIAFDADDTLWFNISLYHKAIKRIKEILGRHIDITSVPQDFYKTESENLPILGYGTKSFIISMIEASIKSSSQMILASEIQEIISIGKELINSPVKLLDNVEKVVMELAASNLMLMLITKGDIFEQQIKIDRSGLKKYFHHIEIVNEKDEQTYLNILSKFDIAPKHFIMVGNSLKSDILPVVNIGGNAVYIPHENGWHYEDIPTGLNEKRYYQLEGIGDLPAFFYQKYIGNHR